MAAPLVDCPTCRRKAPFAADNPWRPFCSERCRMIDLGAWASETFRVAAEPSEDDAETPRSRPPAEPH